MVGIIGAMEEEVRELIEDMTECEMQEKASMKFYKGQLYGKEAVVVQSGIGKVNAGICTQILIDFYQVDQLINTGVAGSLDAEINIGDIVVSTDAVEHDMDVSALGDPVGQVPRMDVFAFPFTNGYSAISLSITGVFARATALPSVLSLNPYPSKIINTVGFLLISISPLH